MVTITLYARQQKRHRCIEQSFVILRYVHAKLLQSCLTLCDPMNQDPLSMGFSRQECWSGLPCPPLGHLPDPGSNLSLLCLLHWQAGSLPLALSGKTLAQNAASQNTEMLRFAAEKGCVHMAVK